MTLPTKYTVVSVMGATYAVRDNLTYEYVWCGPEEEAHAVAARWNDDASNQR